MIKKRGQLTLFVIVGLVFVALILVFFLYVQPTFISSSGELKVEICVREAIEKNILELSKNAGVEKPTFVYQYRSENITILCYSDEYYKPCVTQQSPLVSSFTENLKKMSERDILICYENSISDLKSKGYDVLQGEIKTELELQPDRVKITLNSPTAISSQGESRTFGRFEIIIASEIYQVLNIATSILQYETSYGDVETQTLMLFYPNLLINKIRQDGGMKVYTIENKQGLLFRFASRSYAWPPGYGV